MAVANRANTAEAGRARMEAVTQLVAEHREEYNRLHINARVAHGLTPYPTGRTPAEIQKSIARAKSQLARWEAQLAGVTNGLASTV